RRPARVAAGNHDEVAAAGAEVLMRRALLLLALAAGSVALTACAGGGAMSLDPVAAAAQKTVSSRGEQVAFTANADAAGQSITIDGDGVFDNRGRRGEMHLRFRGGGQSASLDEVLDGDTGYLRSDIFADKLP